jgi:hypothetical protein
MMFFSYTNGNATTIENSNTHSPSLGRNALPQGLDYLLVRIQAIIIKGIS